jgi:hypothetical protein
MITFRSNFTFTSNENTSSIGVVIWKTMLDVSFKVRTIIVFSSYIIFLVFPTCIWTNWVWNISCLGYNPKLCVLKSLFVIGNFITHKFVGASFLCFYTSFYNCCVNFVYVFWAWIPIICRWVNILKMFYVCVDNNGCRY